MKVPVAFLDACVMYSRTLCDWLFMLRLEMPGMFLLVSSTDAIEETTYHLRKANPKADGALTERRRKLLHDFLDDVVSDFSGDVVYPGDDIDDHHIHAAATHVGARYLITDDTGFARFGGDDVAYEAHTADSFLCLIAENAPGAIQAVMVRQLAYWSERNGAKSLSQALRDAGCLEFAARIELAMKALSEGRTLQGVVTVPAKKRP
jgi:hypothetical protein